MSNYNSAYLAPYIFNKIDKKQSYKNVNPALPYSVKSPQ